MTGHPIPLLIAVSLQMSLCNMCICIRSSNVNQATNSDKLWLRPSLTVNASTIASAKRSGVHRITIHTTVLFLLLLSTRYYNTYPSWCHGDRAVINITTLDSFKFRTLVSLNGSVFGDAGPRRKTIITFAQNDMSALSCQANQNLGTTRRRWTMTRILLPTNLGLT